MRSAQSTSFANLTFQTAADVKSSLGYMWSSHNVTSATENAGGIPPVVLRPEVKDFERQPGVVVVTKIHDDLYMPLLVQQYCLFTAAYNHKMQYDLILFSTEPIGQEHRKELAEAVYPANLTIYIDEKTIADHVSELDENQTAYLLRRCKVNSTDELTWRTRCWEHGGGEMPIAYTWVRKKRRFYSFELLVIGCSPYVPVLRTYCCSNANSEANGYGVILGLPSTST